MKTSFTLFFTLLTIFVKGQNLIFIGDRAFQSTQSWFFEGNGSQFEYYGKDATIQVGKKGESGIFLISTLVYSSSWGIKGSIRIYLDNATTIVLSKILSRDYADQYSTVVYEITNVDLKKLKNSDINTIRFNSGISGQMQGSTASNRWDSNPDPIRYEPIHWNTATEISKLFE